MKPRTTPTRSETALERYHREQRQREDIALGLAIFAFCILAICYALYTNGIPHL